MKEKGQIGYSRISVSMNKIDNFTTITQAACQESSVCASHKRPDVGMESSISGVGALKLEWEVRDTGNDACNIWARTILTCVTQIGRWANWMENDKVWLCIGKWDVPPGTANRKREMKSCDVNFYWRGKRDRVVSFWEWWVDDIIQFIKKWECDMVESLLTSLGDMSF